MKTSNTRNPSLRKPHVTFRPQRDRLEAFQREKSYVRRNRERLIEEFEGRFIAVMGDSLVDNDEDFSALAERVFSKFGYKPIFMPLIRRDGRVYRIPGPRTQR